MPGFGFAPSFRQNSQSASHLTFEIAKPILSGFFGFSYMSPDFVKSADFFTSYLDRPPQLDLPVTETILLRNRSPAPAVEIKVTILGWPGGRNQGSVQQRQNACVGDDLVICIEPNFKMDRR